MFFLTVTREISVLKKAELCVHIHNVCRTKVSRGEHHSVCWTSLSVERSPPILIKDGVSCSLSDRSQDWASDREKSLNPRKENDELRSTQRFFISTKLISIMDFLTSRFRFYSWTTCSTKSVAHIFVKIRYFHSLFEFRNHTENISFFRRFLKMEIPWY